MNAFIFSFILSIVSPLSYGSTQTTENVKKVIHTCKKTDTAVSILACNMYRESRGESDRGMIAVGFVTLNRKDSEQFPQTIKKIVYQPGQFSWTNKTSSFNVHDADDWERAKKFATMLILVHNTSKNFYNAIDLTHSSVYYHSKTVKPYWAKDMVKTVKIENHVFYKEKPDS